MSDRREAQEKPLIILQNAEDYPTWKSYTISRLQQQSCDWAITGRPQPNLDSMRETIIQDGFAQADLRPSTLVSALRDEKKDYLTGLTKNPGTCQQKPPCTPERQNRPRDVGNPRSTVPSYLSNERHSNILRCLYSQTLGLQGYH